MKKIIVTMLLVSGLVLSGTQCSLVQDIRQDQITSFEECVAAGNPVMESYPRQCSTDTGQTFVEQVDLAEFPPPEDQIIGGQRDEHGCLGPAGYSWDAEIGACIRPWELDDDQRRAAQLAVAAVEYKITLTVIEVEPQTCSTCYNVTLETGTDNRQQTGVIIRGWRVTESHTAPLQ